MNTTERNSNEGRIGLEILQMLISHFILRDLTPNTDDRVENLKTMKLTNLLTDDVILRLCKLVDRTGGTLTFERVEKYCSRPVADRAGDIRLRNRINGFCEVVKGLDPLRNGRIAHLSAGDELSVLTMSDEEQRSLGDALCGVYDALREAVLIWDDLTGTVNAYQIERVDLRAALFGRV